MLLTRAVGRGEGVVMDCKCGVGRARTVAVRMLMELRPELAVDNVLKLIHEVSPGTIES